MLRNDHNQQTDKVTAEQVNIVEHIADLKTDISLLVDTKKS